MIAVIADDFTGAAELAGIGLRYGLAVRLYTKGVAAAHADLIVVSTDSRSMNSEAAVETTRDILQDIQQLRPDFIYKKTDSVLRGHVLGELDVQMKTLDLPKALLLPANPSLGRTITAGKYYVNDQPVNETAFANDPEFAITSASVREMAHASEKDQVFVLKHTDALPSAGIIIGEAVSSEDIAQWALLATRNYTLAGAGDFFEAILQKRHTRKAETNHFTLNTPHLYISGTTFQQSTDIIRRIAAASSCVHYLNRHVLIQGEYGKWIERIQQSFNEHQKAVVAIDPEEPLPPELTAATLRQSMAEAVKALISTTSVCEIMIEGGSTAAAILEAQDAWGFIPVNELARGVLRMKMIGRDMFITVKPGSYRLPEQITELYLPTHKQQPE